MAISIKLILLLIFLLGAAVASVGWYIYNRKKTGWIAVADALPGTDRPVLVYNEEYKRVEMFWIENNGIGLTGITKWQPLPEPPK